MSREEIIAAIRKCARKLKRAPRREEVSRAGVSLARVSRLFGCFSQALREAGLAGKGSGYLIPTRELLLDWARCARKLGRLPFLSQYSKVGRSSHGPFLRRFGTWREVPAAFQRLTRELEIEDEWKDVLEMVRRRQDGELRKSSLPPYARQWGDMSEPARAALLAPLRERPRESGTKEVRAETRAVKDSGRRESLRRRFRKGRALAGPPLPSTGLTQLNGLAHEPVNEQGVVFFFGMLAERLGFRVLSFHPRFPDCEAMREVRPGHWQRVGIEFEYESRNYRIHGHRGDGCDLIVCWRHNWPGCPKSLEIIELKGLVGRL
jgi:Homing endonuclease associated repeat